MRILPTASPSSCAAAFAGFCDAMQRAVLIQRASRSDKEFHFQNWVGGRLDDAGLRHDTPGRNSYPDFTLVHHPEGYEVKGLGWPGREASYDSNSRVPTGMHNDRTIWYVFGRYPAGTDDAEYPVVDLVLCHGDFLNADHTYAHKNRSFKGFGSYGDLLVRDRKMYVAPTAARPDRRHHRADDTHRAGRTPSCRRTRTSRRTHQDRNRVHGNRLLL